MPNGAYEMLGNQRYNLRPRDYVVDIVHDAVAGTTATGFINIDPNSPFMLTSRHMNDTNDPTTAAPGLAGQYENLIQVIDQSDNYLWENDFEFRSGFAKDRTHGYDLPRECLIQANTRLSLTIKNPAAAAAAGTTKITLRGFSLYAVQ